MSEQAAYKGVEKVDFVATLEKNTCHICGELDGTVYPLEDIATGGHGTAAPPELPMYINSVLR